MLIQTIELVLDEHEAIVAGTGTIALAAEWGEIEAQQFLQTPDVLHGHAEGLHLGELLAGPPARSPA